MTAVAGNESGDIDVGPSLKASLRRIERFDRMKAIVLIAPLLFFLLVFLVVPIVSFLSVSVRDPEVSAILPETSRAILPWDGTGLPEDDVARVFARELVAARDGGTIGQVARRLNHGISGYRSLILETGRAVPDAGLHEGSALDQLAEIDGRWTDREYWVALKGAAAPLTDFYLLAAFDLLRNVDGGIDSVPVDRAVYVDILLRTVWISSVVTILCLALGYPLAYLMANLPARRSNLVLFCILIPFYTSLLVRTTAWLVLLQRQGVVNDVAHFLGLWDERVQLVHNRFGVYLALVHIFLPFMVLPIYSVMKGISPHHIRAARSLGAGPVLAFREAYLPQTFPGIAAGCLLVFILCLGVYVTPALVGGPGDQMLSYFIAYYTNRTVNWGMAAALSLVLLALVLVLFSVYNRLVGLDRMRLG